VNLGGRKEKQYYKILYFYLDDFEKIVHVLNLYGKYHLGYRNGWEDNIKTDFIVVGCGDMNWIQQA
jgi:hypothetical protein